MPIKKCIKKGEPGFKYGDDGFCYVFNPKDPISIERAKKDAERQGIIIEISKKRKNGSRI